jgi:hypothetical protein
VFQCCHKILFNSDIKSDNVCDGARHFLLILLIEVLLTSEDRQDDNKQPRPGLLQLIKLPRLKPNMLKKLKTLKIDKLI